MATEEMQSAAEATAHQVEAEQRILQLHASLSAAEESAEAALQVRSRMALDTTLIQVTNHSITSSSGGFPGHSWLSAPPVLLSGRLTCGMCCFQGFQGSF